MERLINSTRRLGLAAGCFAMVAACGGGGSPTPRPSASPTPTPTATSAACSLRARQDWARAQLDEWYLFPSLLNLGADPASYTSMEAYIDALVAPARAQGRDRFFTYLTSIAAENAYYEQGDFAGYGIRLSFDSTTARLFITESFEGGSALANGIDRGSEILGIGTSASTVRSVSSIFATGGTAALIDALGPDTTGLTRVFQVRDQSGIQREVSIAKTTFTLQPVSDRYGAKVLTDGARKVGYINLRTFIDTADPQLRAAFAQFQAQGVTELIVDLRYNGGGLISIAELFGDLMGGGHIGQPFEYITFRPSKSANNESYSLQAQPEAIAPVRIAFIGTGGTASASEIVINGFVPYLGTSMALIGSNTYGKPVGQIALDKPECDDRLRAIALQIENADHQGEYYSGLASTVPRTCRASDDIAHPLGDPNEAMTRVALDFLAGRSCTAIAGIGPQAVAERGLLTPSVPQSTIQREMPGAY